MEQSSRQDPLWLQIRKEVEEEASREPMLASFFHATILKHRRLEDALSFLLASKLGGHALSAMSLREVFDESFAKAPEIAVAVRVDLQGVYERDPACPSLATPLMYFKGFQALQAHRIAHWLWTEGRQTLARHLQSSISELFAVDIHPAARIGSGVFIDHGTGVVIGETAVVGDNVSILQHVTLGGTGKETGDRHPKIHSGVLISAGAKVLGNIVVGTGAKIGAGSVVLSDVPPHSTVAGVPAKVVGTSAKEPALQMDQSLPKGRGTKASR
jgi:serine O-acetyltransferase